MKETLERCCRENQTGLLLLNLPTGFGKTHTVLDFIDENYEKNRDEGGKIFFITPLKKNLHYPELRDRFIADGKGESFDKDCLVIDAVSKGVIKHYDKEKIPKAFRGEEYGELNIHMATLKNPDVDPELKEYTKMIIRTKLEPAFRKKIKAVLRKKHDSGELKERVKYGEEYGWLRELYPMILFEDKKVVFMSLKKFLTRNTPIYKTSKGSFYEELGNDDLVFFDEFDYTKEVMLDTIIENEKQEFTDILSFVRTIQNGVKLGNYKPLLEKSKWLEKKILNKQYQDPVKIYNAISGYADRIFEDFHLENRYKMSDEMASGDRPFLFYDQVMQKVLHDQKKRVMIKADTENDINLIQYCDEVSAEMQTESLRYMLNSLFSFLDFFERRIMWLAMNYYHLKIEDTTSIDPDKETCILTFLNHMNLGNTADYKVLLKNILAKWNRTDSRNDTDADDNVMDYADFYKNGFAFFHLIDRPEHASFSMIQLTAFNNTPEKILLDICNKAFLIGLSATASLDTVLGNYDIDYLKDQLGDRFIEITDKEKDRLKKHYGERLKGYEEIRIVPEIISTIQPVEDSEIFHDRSTELFGELDPMKRLHGTIEWDKPTDNEVTFIFNRYLKLLEAWKRFLETPGIKGMICFLNKFPKIGDSKFDESLLLELMKCVAENSLDNPASKKAVDDCYEKLDSENYAHKSNELKQAMSRGKRRFIVTTYQTVGVGQNLQYVSAERDGLIPVHELYESEEVDIDSVYLEKPTNLIVSRNSDAFDEAGFQKFIFQLEFLKNNGSISVFDFNDYVKEAYNKLKNSRYSRLNRGTNLYSTEDYQIYANKIIIQALGRICRAKWKSTRIHILLDDQLQPSISAFHGFDKELIIQEYNALHEMCGSAGKNTDVFTRKEMNIAVLKTVKLNAEIKQLMKRWTAKGITTWQNLRAFVIQHPTLSGEVYNRLEKPYKQLYIKPDAKLSRYWFYTSDDFQTVRFNFETKEKSFSEVSDDNSGLAYINKISFLNDLFVNNGFALRFEQNDYILSPVAFRNLYKGYIGEFCGKNTVEKETNLKLLELDPDEFELFDFKTENGFYFDFKNWNETVYKSAKREIEMISKKLTKLNRDYKKVFVVNCFEKSASENRILKNNNIIEIPGLYKGAKLNRDSIETMIKECVENG